MNKPAIEQNEKSRLNGFGTIVISATAVLLAVFIYWLFLFQSITGAFSPLPKGGGNISQWCQPGSSKRIKGPEFSADESKIVLTMDGSCKIGIYVIDTESMVYLTPPKDSAVFDATFDPQSSTIAFILAKQVDIETIDYQLATSQIDGSGLRVLTSSDTQKRLPAYSSDGKKIVFEGRERCKPTSAEHCWGDIYEFDFQSNKETRITNLKASHIAPVHYLPGNRKIVASIYGNLRPDGEGVVPVEKKYGEERAIFIVDASNGRHFEQLPIDTPTASSPKSLPSGDIAFISRVNEYENIKGNYIYDVFLWSNGVSRRLTQFNRFIWDYAITDSAQSVLLVTEAKADASQCGLMLWNVSERAGRNLRCDVKANELPLTP